MHNWNYIYKILTIITLNNTTLGIELLPKTFLNFYLIKFLQAHKHNVLIKSYYQLQLAHVFKFWFAPTTVSLLVEKCPRS